MTVVAVVGAPVLVLALARHLHEPVVLTCTGGSRVCGTSLLSLTLELNEAAVLLAEPPLCDWNTAPISSAAAPAAASTSVRRVGLRLLWVSEEIEWGVSAIDSVTVLATPDWWSGSSVASECCSAAP